MWYENCFRRHLCDMHIEDWNPSFLSRFDPEEYVKCLKLARIQNAMLYFQSHVGLCYYPTESGKMHNALNGREDTMRRLVDRCHEEGISVTGYYSVIYNTWAHDQYPEWQLRDAEGLSVRVKKNSRYGLCCPNNPDYRVFVQRQIEEMASFFTVDGMFYDMLFWPHMCYCDHCKARWEKEVGTEMPVLEDWNDEGWLLHMRKRREWMGEFAQWVTDLTKQLMPGVSVEHNCAYSALPNGKTANAEEVLAACDYVGGDLHKKSMFTQSLACKLYRNITRNQPFEYMFARCSPSLSAHTQIKSVDIMRSIVFLTAAHHGATLVIDAVDPIGTMDERVYRRVGEVFSELIPYEPYLHGDMVEDVGIYYSLKSKFNKRGEKCTNYLGAETAIETMVANHWLCGITGGFRPIEGYPLLIASCLTEEDAYDFDRLVRYVEDGGTLYLSGSDCPTLLQRFFSAEVTGRTEESVVYLAPCPQAEEIFTYFNKTYPLHFGETVPYVKGIAEEYVLATLTLPYTVPGKPQFASIHSNPPGIWTEWPMVALRRYGKGTVVWSAAPIECNEQYDYRLIFSNLLKYATDMQPTVTTDAPADVEVTLFRQEQGLLLHTVLLNAEPVARKVADFEVRVRCQSKPVAVRLVPDGASVPFVWDDNVLTFPCRSMGMFQTYEVLFEGEEK